VLTPLIRSFSRPGDIVLDPFCGSGSTLLAAKLQGRSFIGIELDPAYYNIALDRLLAKAA
jgi:site-specific DNA-methyltransferase (adenine-specific)